MFWLAIAILSLLLGHLVKVYRWRLFIGLYERPTVSVLLKSLAVAHAINFIIPLHVGDLYRIWYSGRRMANGIKFSLATIVVEHYIDLIVLALICSVLYAIGHNTMGTMVLLSTIAATVVLLTLVTMRWNNKTKRIIVSIAEIFNQHIELSILGFTWTFVSIFKKLIMSISKVRIVASTGLMWVLYMGSYWSIAEALQSAGVAIRLRDVVDIFFNRSSVMNSQLFSYEGDAHVITLYMSLYVLLPLLIIYATSWVGYKRAESKVPVSGSIIPHVNSRDALLFLETFFKGNVEGAYLKGFLEVNKDVSILEDHSAGSNAVTLLCTDGRHTFWRKFAIGVDGEKLYQQIEWLQKHQGTVHLPEILAVRKDEAYCSYDMPHNSEAQNFFTYIHTHRGEDSWRILHRALEDMRQSLYHYQGKATDEVINAYIDKKVTRNLDIIRHSPILTEMLKYEKVTINGVRYDNLPRLDRLFAPTRLMRLFEESPVCDIHGDLTIENIICLGDDYYLIDPNTGNLLDSPYLDLGKLFQSLHGGYEFLMRVRDVTVGSGCIDFTFMRSAAYDELYQRLRQYIVDTYGVRGLRQVYGHELIHWLRLMPYKLSHLGERALIFYAGLIMAANDVIHINTPSRAK